MEPDLNADPANAVPVVEDDRSALLAGAHAEFWSPNMVPATLVVV